METSKILFGFVFLMIFLQYMDAKKIQEKTESFQNKVEWSTALQSFSNQAPIHLQLQDAHRITTPGHAVGFYNKAKLMAYLKQIVENLNTQTTLHFRVGKIEHILEIRRSIASQYSIQTELLEPHLSLTLPVEVNFVVFNDDTLSSVSSNEIYINHIKMLSIQEIMWPSPIQGILESPVQFAPLKKLDTYLEANL